MWDVERITNGTTLHTLEVCETKESRRQVNIIMAGESKFGYTDVELVESLVPLLLVSLLGTEKLI